MVVDGTGIVLTNLFSSDFNCSNPQWHKIKQHQWYPYKIKSYGSYGFCCCFCCGNYLFKNWTHRIDFIQQGLMICTKKFCFKWHAVLSSVDSKMYFPWFSKSMIHSHELCGIKQNHPPLLLSLNFIIYKTGTMPSNLLQFLQVSMVSRIVKFKFKNQGNVNSSGSCSVRTACHPSYCNDSILAL